MGFLTALGQDVNITISPRCAAAGQISVFEIS
jgi:hypothetical protein